MIQSWLAAGPAPPSLNDRIGDFAGLVGLVLVLITLYTTQRGDALDALEAAAGRGRAEYTRHMWLTIALVVVTVLLFAAGLPLFFDAICALHPLRNEGPLRSAFVIVWLLLPVLFVWQGSLAADALQARKQWDSDHGR
jgi:uncharacterized membrane protein